MKETQDMTEKRKVYSPFSRVRNSSNKRFRCTYRIGGNSFG